MNYSKTWAVCILILGCFSGGWTQDKLPGKAALNALSASKPLRVAETPAQVLARVRPFIEQHQRRPRSSITQQGVLVPPALLPPDLHQEVLLGTAVQRIFTRAKSGRIDPRDLNVIELQRLVAAHPNPVYIKPKSFPDAALVLQQAQQFIDQEGVRPRTVIYNSYGLSKTKQECNVQEQEEIALGKNIYQVLHDAEFYPADQQPTLTALRELIQAHPRVTAPSARELLESLQDFINQNGRRPRALFHKNSILIATDQLTPQQLKEAQLARHVSYLVSQVTQHKKPADPDVEALVALWKNGERTTLNDAALLENLTAWVAAHNGCRPRLNIYGADGRHLPVKEMTPAQREEYTLARLLEQKLRNRLDDKQLREKLWEIKQLPTTARH